MSFLLNSFLFAAGLTDHYVTSAQHETASNSSPESFAFDAGAAADDRLLLVWVTHDKGTARDVTAMTYNGVSMTRSVAHHPAGAASAEPWQDLWYLVAPATGSNTLSLTVSETGGDMLITPVVYKNIDQAAPITQTANLTFQQTADVQQTLTGTAANSLVVQSASSARSDGSEGTGAASGTNDRQNYDSATGADGLSAYVADSGPNPAGGSVTIGYSTWGAT